jgi:hypothetical protein
VPKGEGSGVGAPNSPTTDGAPPAERRNLTHSGICMERGKPAGLPKKESEPQGTLTDLRARDGGKSEGHAVTVWIGVEMQAASTSPHAQAGRLPNQVVQHKSA